MPSCFGSAALRSCSGPALRRRDAIGAWRLASSILTTPSGWCWGVVVGLVCGC